MRSPGCELGGRLKIIGIVATRAHDYILAVGCYRNAKIFIVVPASNEVASLLLLHQSLLSSLPIQSFELDHTTVFEVMKQRLALRGEKLSALKCCEASESKYFLSLSLSYNCSISYKYSLAILF